MSSFIVVFLFFCTIACCSVQIAFASIYFMPVHPDDGQTDKRDAGDIVEKRPAPLPFNSGAAPGGADVEAVQGLSSDYCEQKVAALSSEMNAILAMPELTHARKLALLNSSLKANSFLLNYCAKLLQETKLP